MGRGSPRRGSREIETQNRDKIVTLIGYIKTHNPYFPLWKSIQHIYETPEILRSMIFSTVSCLESDNDVSTSNTPFPMLLLLLEGTCFPIPPLLIFL